MDSKEFEISIKQSCERIKGQFLGKVLDEPAISKIVALVANNTINLMLTAENVRAASSDNV